MAQQEKDDRLTPDLEYKDTRGTVLGYTAAPVPHENRVGSALTDEERKRADSVVGSPAQGNGLSNDSLVGVGGLATDSGGTQSEPAPSTSTEKSDAAQSSTARKR